MAQLSDKPLRPNPFTAYRDAKTGQWVTVQPETAPESQSDRLPISSEGLPRSPAQSSLETDLQYRRSRWQRQCSRTLSQYLTESLHCDCGISPHTRDRVRSLLSIGRRLYFSDRNLEIDRGQMALLDETTTELVELSAH